eukprot:2098794-Pleurochrysis_carterae.AAC.1
MRISLRRRMNLRNAPASWHNVSEKHRMLWGDAGQLAIKKGTTARRRQPKLDALGGHSCDERLYGDP